MREFLRTRFVFECVSVCMKRFCVLAVFTCVCANKKASL